MGSLKSEGQAVVEYVIMVAVTITIVLVMAAGFRKTVISLWGFYIKQISAACPGCQPNPRYRIR